MVKVKLVVTQTNDNRLRYVTVTTEPCEGYGFWLKCQSSIIDLSKGSYVEFDLPDKDTYYITVSAPDSSITWEFEVFKNGNRCGTVIVNGGYKASSIQCVSLPSITSSTIILAILGLIVLVALIGRRRK